MQTPVRTVPPATGVLTLAEIKAHLRVDHTNEDALIAIYLDAATAHLDGWTGILGRCLVTQTWVAKFEEFEAEMDLPFPGAAVSSVTYYDGANALQTLASTVYTVSHEDGGSHLELKFGQAWPTTYDRPDAIAVTATYGFGSAADVPSSLKAAIMLHVGAMFENRGDSEPPAAHDALVGPYRLVRF